MTDNILKLNIKINKTDPLVLRQKRLRALESFVKLFPDRHISLKIDLRDILDSGKNIVLRIIAVLFKGRSSLKKLDLSNGMIGDEGAKIISDLLKTNTGLEKLDLSYNNISDEGAKAIGEALQENTSLKELDLSYNNISNTKVSIANLIKMGELETLNLSYNQITTSNFEFFLDLENNNHLKKLDLSCNYGISPHINKNGENFIMLPASHEFIAKKIGIALSKNVTLECLDLSLTEIQNHGWHLIIQGLKENKLRTKPLKVLTVGTEISACNASEFDKLAQPSRFLESAQQQAPVRSNYHVFLLVIELIIKASSDLKSKRKSHNQELTRSPCATLID